MGSTTIVTVAHRDQRVRVRQVRVQVEAGPDAGAEAVLTKRALGIGTHPSNELVLSDPKVSRFHLRIAADETGYRVVDTNSANGTFLNGTRVRDAYLADGARLDLGASRVAVQFLQQETEIELSEEEKFGGAVGRGVRMREVFALARRAAATNTTVLLLGETGTGKDVLARAIHDHSPRARGPFQVFDCGAVSPTLIESALFGHVRGAFTGADMERAGVFERATGGTLFLDEVGELPLDLQPKLLRALESGTVTPLGGGQPVPVSVRMIAATNRDLPTLVDQDRFRADLYYRLAVIPIEIPPLRDRVEDIPLLAAHFLRDLLARDGRDPAWLRPHLDEAFGGLAAHPWPGNVRELRNVVERAAALADPGELAKGGLAQLVEIRSSIARTQSAILPIATAREQFDREYLRDLLDACQGDVHQAAQAAGIHPKSLERLLRRYRIPRK